MARALSGDRGGSHGLRSERQAARAIRIAWPSMCKTWPDWSAQLNLGGVTLVAHDWGGAIGLGARAGRTGPLCPLCDAQHRGLSLAAHPAADSRLPHADFGAAGRAGVQRVRPGGAAHGHRKTRAAHAGRASGLVRALPIRGRTGGRSSGLSRTSPCRPATPVIQRSSNIETRLPSLARHPWQLIWGMRDWCFTPEFLERFREFFPQAEVHRLADAGHYVVEDAYERIGPLVEQFLAAHPLRPAGARPRR